MPNNPQAMFIYRNLQKQHIPDQKPLPISKPARIELSLNSLIRVQARIRGFLTRKKYKRPSKWEKKPE